MKEEANSGCQPQETGLRLISIRSLFDAYLSSEYFRSDYKKSTQILYTQDLRRLLKLSKIIGQFEADRLPKLINEYANIDKSPEASRTITAIRRAATWGIAEGLLDDDLDINFQPRHCKDRSPFIDYNVSPLSSEDLKKLMQATDKKPRDKALILTVLLTRGSTDIVRELTKASISKDKNGTATIATNNFKMKIPEEASSALLSYAKSLKPGPLFPCRNEPNRPLTRQAMHVIFQKYKEEVRLSNLSHRTLVRTGVHMFGDPSQINHSLQTPQIPEP